jgi:hypothetical protein
MSKAKKKEVRMKDLLGEVSGTLAVSFEAITDSARKHPVIPKDSIANALVCAGVLGSQSLRHTDGILRQDPVRDLLDSQRPCVASDTTLSRVCAGFQGIEQSLTVFGQSLFQGRARSRLGIIDGSSLGGQLASVLLEVGDIPRYWGLAPIPKHGKELPVSLELIGQAAEAAGFRYILGDGLYASERFWKACDQVKAKGLVKTTDDAPFALLHQARMLFDHPVRGERVGYQFIEGCDADRSCTYKVWLTSGLWANTRRRLAVARVQETYLKGPRAGQTETFWVFSQDLELTPNQIRELAHGRWFIENNGFRALNEQTHRKHQASHDAHTALAIATFQAMAFMAIAAYKARLAHHKDQLRSLWDHGQLSFRLLRSALWISLALPSAESP